MIWTVVSPVLLYVTNKKNQALREHLKSRVSTVFEYQSRYDEVYEVAYPSQHPSLPKTESIAAAAILEPKILGESHVLNDPTSAEVGVRLEDGDKIHSFTKLTGTAHDRKWPIEVEDVSIHRDGEDLEVTFAIRNRNSPTRIDGYIWGVVRIKDEHGRRKFIVSPQSINLEESGKIASSNQGAWFSIRYHKTKSLFFSLPEHWTGHLEGVEIGMQNTEGEVGKIKVNLPKGDHHLDIFEKMSGPISVYRKKSDAI